MGHQKITSQSLLSKTATWLCLLASLFVFLGFDSLVQGMPEPSESLVWQQALERPIISLGYNRQTVYSVVKLMETWAASQKEDALTSSSEELHAALQANDDERRSAKQISRMQKKLARTLAVLVRNKMTYHQDWFELKDVVEKQQGQCLGLTQLYYVLGSALGLHVEPVTVIAAQADQRWKPGESHVACLVHLADDTVMMIDVVPTGSTSIPFTFQRHYVKKGPYDVLKGRGNPLDLYRKIQRLDAHGLHAQLYNARGAQSFKQEKYTEAITHYTRALELNPANAEAYGNRAAAYLKSGELNKALEDCRHCLHLNPQMEEAYNTQGVILTRQQQYDRALGLFSRAIDIQPNFAKAYNNRGCVYNQLEKYPLAIKDFHKALRLDQSYVSARVNCATSYRKLGDYQRAVAEYTRAIAQDADCHQAYIYRGLTYALMDESDRARQDLAKAVELKPTLNSLVQTISKRFDLNHLLTPSQSRN